LDVIEEYGGLRADHRDRATPAGFTGGVDDGRNHPRTGAAAYPVLPAGRNIVGGGLFVIQISV
jgi:hypothetical protein